MILLLAADYDDARRWDELPGRPDDEAILIAEPRDVEAHARIIPPGARIIVTDRCTPRPGVVSALQALHARIGLVDPTGLLGPLDPDRRRPAEGTPPVGGANTSSRPGRGRDHRSIGTQL